ncbi:hypothetical protein [Plantibacter sp. ME-Dv--P-122b]|uniref:hypothetical protein n=1 Tax=Plantibacter sp. ME-Dv--P-122b TaxID=3040300 RepID=UPI00254ED588|nr:hypothetical protein [Plantibacter sp. ME-Dv--P-122b]
MSDPSPGRANEPYRDEAPSNGTRVWVVAATAALIALVLQIILRVVIDRLASAPTEFFSADDTNESRVTLVFGLSLMFIFPTALYLQTVRAARRDLTLRQRIGGGGRTGGQSRG